MLPRILGENDFQIVHVRSVIVECKESTTLASAMSWISRQLLTVRLHHRSWPLVLGHAIFSGVCFVGAVAAIAWLLLTQHYFQGIRLLLVLIAFLIGNAVMLQMIQVANRRGTQSRGPGFLGALMTQVLYPLIAIKAALMQKVQWRGITYSIKPGKKISMEAYVPYQESSKGPDTSL